MIGILTYHDGFNYGAYLQVYALQNTLKNYGIENKIINYKSKEHFVNEYLCFLKTKNPLLLMKNIVKIIKFLIAHKKLELTDFCFEMSKLKDRSFDAVIFGSDEIWNYKNPIIGKDLSFFGKNVPAQNFVSYAVSCGNLDSDGDIDGDVKALISDFNSISVRDENSRKIVSKATGRDAVLVLDPTLIYDFSSLEEKCVEKNFILFYGTGLTKKEQDEIKTYAKERGKRLISFGYRNDFCDESAVAKGPFEFLGYIKAADEVITTMFHGTLFCIKYQKRFSIYTDEYRTNKLATVLKFLDLEDRRVGVLSLSEIQAKPIDYDAINKKLEDKKKHSIDFILSSVAS